MTPPAALRQHGELGAEVRKQPAVLDANRADRMPLDAPTSCPGMTAPHRPVQTAV